MACRPCKTTVYYKKHKLLDIQQQPLKMGRASKNETLTRCENEKRQRNDTTTDGDHIRRPDYDNVWEVSEEREDSLKW